MSKRRHTSSRGPPFHRRRDPEPSRRRAERVSRRRCKIVTAAREPPPGGLGRPLVGTARRRRAAGRTPSSGTQRCGPGACAPREPPAARGPGTGPAALRTVSATPMYGSRRTLGFPPRRDHFGTGRPSRRPPSAGCAGPYREDWPEVGPVLPVGAPVRPLSMGFETRRPRSAARIARLIARWVFPTPGGPRNTTFSCRRRKSSRAATICSRVGT